MAQSRLVLQPRGPGVGFFGNSQAVLCKVSGFGHAMLQRAPSGGCVTTQSVLTARLAGAPGKGNLPANLWRAVRACA